VQTMNNELFRAEDEYGVVVVTEQGDKRILCFGSELQQSSIYTQKPFHLVHEYTQIMLLGLVFNEVKNIGILGLGGGGLVNCLHHYYPNTKIQVMEIRQLVIDVAFDWFYLPETENIRVICDDANEHVKKLEPAGTDLLLCDLYEAQGMSEVQVQVDFIRGCHQSLSNNGCMVINFHSMPGDDSKVMKQIRLMFIEILVCDVFKGNWVIFCAKTQSCFDKGEIKTRVKQLAKKIDAPMMYYYKQLQRI
jgi:spermidine synthase